MKIKWFLILAPTLLSLGLLQSYFWVPTYESQTKGNPDRVVKFIEASIGDAKILNPALNSDTASSRIAGLVFEGLLDYDENLNLRARLATDWTLTESAYLIINPDAHFPDGTRVTASEMESRLKKAIENGSGLKENVTDIELLPPDSQLRTKVILMPVAEDKSISVKVEIKPKIPERIKFSLRRVDQNFFNKLIPIIGADYEKNAPSDKWIVDIRYYKKPEPSKDEWVEFSPPEPEKLRPKLADVMPIVFEHNPIILFHLRKGVRFHDGHELDAGDVKFTYEAILNPKNMSPRSSDF
jgi:ABC-type transport system substrate-binding protein